MPQSNVKQWDATTSVSLDGPSDYELKLTDDLGKALIEYDLFETANESSKRSQVLKKLDEVAKEFVYKVSRLQGMPEEEAKGAGVKIFTFGSYQLGVHGADADIDTLCVFPQHVTRDHFFTIMYDMLNQIPEVSELTAVVEAYVPVIKMHFEGIPIDFVCARLCLPSIPKDLDLSDNHLLIGMDEKCIRSVNGARVTNEILRLVPSVPTFREALRAIKLWAKQRSIYSNIMGFLGGVAWAMLVAKVCQMYPKACASVIVSRFFHIMADWKWPQPVFLKPMEEGSVPTRQWNPDVYPADRAHRMPIITPVFPSMCATHNVTDSTKKIMMDEFLRASQIVDSIMTGARPWKDLFQPIDFFCMYNHYLQITASSKSHKTQLQWAGLIESKIRQLVLQLELLEPLELAHSFIHGIEKVHYCLSKEEQWYIAYGHSIDGRSFPMDSTLTRKDYVRKMRLAIEQERSMTPLYTTTFYVGLKFKSVKDSPTNNRKLDLIWPKREFLKMAKIWDKFNPETMGIALRHIKSSTLPSELKGALKQEYIKSVASPIAVVETPKSEPL
ncbi:Putative Poly(A) polymerase [Rhizopus microsporus]|nr:Putative Poly(A) polymerase [Rhizopus microsporus]